jgi:hypothetical protein
MNNARMGRKDFSVFRYQKSVISDQKNRSPATELFLVPPNLQEYRSQENRRNAKKSGLLGRGQLGREPLK